MPVFYNINTFFCRGPSAIVDLLTHMSALRIAHIRRLAFTYKPNGSDMRLSLIHI